MVRYSTLAIASLATYTTCAAAEAAPDTETAPDVGIFFHISGRDSSPMQLLGTRSGGGDAKCFKSQTACDGQCIDGMYVCCNVGQGQACQPGYTCYSQGCCREGQTCSGPPKGCTATTKVCDIGCIPKDRTCCGYGDGSSCDSDTVCLASGLCGRQQSELGPSSGGDKGGGGGPQSSGQTSQSVPQGTSAVAGGQSTSKASLKTLSDTAIGASVTSSVVVSSGAYSLLPVTSTTSGSGGGMSSETSSAGSSKSTGTPGASSTSSDKGGAGTAVKAPAILAGLLAVAAYAI